MNWWEWIIALWGASAIPLGLSWWLVSKTQRSALVPCIVGCVIALFAVIFSITLTLYVVNRSVTAESCHNWGVANQRPAKFASYSFFDYGCVTPDGHGNWIPTSQIIVNVPKPEQGS